jgi:hypothetical protein
LKSRIARAATASSASRNYDAFTWLGEIMKGLAGFAVGYDCAHRNQNVAVLTVSSVALIALAVQTAFGAKLGVEAELQEGV